jgi:fructose-bisphosphate aldolase class II
MPLVSMRQLLDHAAENGYGLPAFNVNNMEQVWAIMEAADQLDAPVIMQASAGARKYAGEPFLRHQILAALEAYPHIPIVMHQDHGQSPAVCMAAIKSGFSSVMMDGSLQADGKTVASYEYNVAVTQKVVEFAHSIGVSVEGELGVLGSLETMKGDKEDGHGAEGTMTREQLLTDVNQAADFVKQTNCDALAIAIGTSHGAYKFTKKPTGDILAIDRIAEIHARIPNTHLVMHGSSSVPQELLAEIREFGGDMKETYGVPVEEIVRGIKHGVRKINIDTDIRLAMTGAIRRYFAENPAKFDPRDYLKPAREAAKKICLARYEAFGCAGRASQIKPISLEKMADRYKFPYLRPPASTSNPASCRCASQCTSPWWRWARYLILDLKEMTEWRMLAVAAAIFLLTAGVLVIRYGHVRYPYREDAEAPPGKAYVRE